MSDDGTDADVGEASERDGRTERGGAAEREDAAVVESLRERVAPLSGTDPSLSVADLAPLGEAVAGARVVGMGEATHGTREFFQLKHRVLQYLVRERGCRVFAWEANFSETLAIDRYVRTGEGDPVAAIDGIHFWTWDTEEVLAMVEWIRSFNEDRDPDDRVRFYGVDVQFSAGPAAALREYLDEVDPDYLAGVEGDLRSLEEDDLNEVDDDAFDERRGAAEELIAGLEDRFEDRRGAYADATGDREYRLARRHLRTLRQAFECRRARADDELGEDGFELRDRYMAENVEWVLEFEDADTMALWAHNAHVGTGGDRDGGNEDWEGFDSMGVHLREALGGEYYALGFEFGRGGLQAIPEPEAVEDPELSAFSFDAPPEGSIPDVFERVDRGTWFLDFETAAADPRLAEWLGDRHRGHDLGAVFYLADHADNYGEVALAGQFDGLLFVPETTRARPIER